LASPAGRYFSLLVQREVTKRKHTLEKRRLRRFPRSMTCSGSDELDVLSHFVLRWPSWPADPCARHRSRRFSRGPESKAKAKTTARSRCARLWLWIWLLPFNPLRSAGRGGARRGLLARMASRGRNETWMSSSSGPEHVVTTGNRRQPALLQGVLSLVTFFAQAKKVTPGRRGQHSESAHGSMNNDLALGVQPITQSKPPHDIFMIPDDACAF